MMVMKLVGEGFEGGFMQASRNNDRRCRKDCSADRYVRTRYENDSQIGIVYALSDQLPCRSPPDWYQSTLPLNH
jgi:hypothetical protein